MVKLLKYAAVIPARNEEKYIVKTLSALKNQTVPPNQIIVVDDGSKDRTGEIASEYADVVIGLPDRGYNAVGSPEISNVINQGLKHVDSDVRCVLICGADNILPKKFSEIILGRIESNPRLVVASGVAHGEPYSERSPRGSRIVDARFWRQVNGLQYPVGWGWEDWLYLKAQQLGYESRCFPDVVTYPQRPILARMSAEKAKLWGKAMYALGYGWEYALGRCVLTSVDNPKAGLNMLIGWLSHEYVDRLDIADWVNQMQKKQFFARVWSILKRHGRK